MPYRLSGFADEISTDIQIQMDHLLENGVKFCAMRSANARGVLDLEDFQIKLTADQFRNRGIKFSCIGSPIGKVPITDPFEPELERFKVACTRAKQFDTKVIRVFSFFIPEGENADGYQDEVIKRMTALADHAKEAGVNLLHENEKGIFGDNAARCAAILSGVNRPNLMATFDFANFVQVKQDPLEAWVALKQWVREFHIKDAREDGVVVPIGQGAGQAKAILTEAFANNWAGYLTLEPHLDKSPGLEDKDGGARFKVATQALQALLKEVGAK